ncbi:MAG: DUF86 domain-containing protein [Verrucomicrobiota bacterium]|nr:DUF86 domain-containing protein [Verrucomicrobiota bacterium]
MKYNGIIQKKVAFIIDYRKKLENELNGVEFSEFQRNWAMQRMTERTLQVMVEVVIDISERIIAMENAGPIETASQAINKLVELRVISKSTPYVDMVRFRNLIVHRYEVIEPELLYSIAKNKLTDFNKFVEELDASE